MVDKIEVTVTELSKKDNGRAGYENMYSLVKHVYKDDGEVDTFGFTINIENLEILRARIGVVLIADNKSNNNIKVKTPYHTVYPCSHAR